jgi:iron complex outermembrane receptor protein
VKKSVIALCVGTACQAMAQAPRPEMEHVLVTVPIHRKAAETALPVTVIAGDELRRAMAGTLGETLEDEPGISNSSFGPGVGRPVIRGQSGPRTVNLSNGIAAADVSSLSPDHAVGIDPMLAESIEILRGPATLLYGSGAIGGVVNVQDNRIPRARMDGIHGTLAYRYGEAADMNTVVAKLEGGSEDFAFHLSGTTRDFDDLEIPGLAIDEEAVEAQEALLGIEHDDEGEEHAGEHGEEEFDNTDGFIANTSGDADIITLGGSYHFGDRSYFGLAFNSFETNYGIPPGAHGHEHGEEDGAGVAEEEEEENIRIDLEQKRYDAQLQIHDLAPGLVDVARGFLTYTDYEHVELEGIEIGTQFARDTWEGRLELVREAEDHHVLGLQWRADEFEALGEEAYVPRTDSIEYGIFYLLDFHADGWQVEIGGRADYVERDPVAAPGEKQDFTSFSASGSALYAFSPDWTLGLSLSRSERAPSTEEMFSNLGNSDEQLVTHAATGVIEIGDTGLDSETSLNADLSLSWTGGTSFAELTLFYNQFDDYIFLLNTGGEIDETPVYRYAQDDVDFYGVEFKSSFQLASFGGGDLFIDFFGDMIEGEFDSAGDVPRLPPLRLGSELSWQAEALGAWIRVLEAADQDNPGTFETETDGYTRWDTGLDYRFTLAGENELLAFLKLKNVTDEEIRLSTSFLRNYAPQPGRSIEAGVQLVF